MRALVFSAALLILFFRLYSGTMLHQLHSPILISPEADNTYWLFHMTGIPQLLVSNYWIALLFDILFFLFASLSLIYSESRIFPVLFWIFLVCYCISFNSFLGQHLHTLAGLFFIVIPFMMNKKHFLFLWEGVRYYALFIYASSALWKICRGDLWVTEHFSNILRDQSINILSASPGDFRIGIISFFLSHSLFAYSFFLVGLFFQLSFLAGFFTKRFDKILIAFGILFHTAVYLLMDILYIELFVIYLSMIPFVAKVNKEIFPAEEKNTIFA